MTTLKVGDRVTHKNSRSKNPTVGTIVGIIAEWNCFEVKWDKKGPNLYPSKDMLNKVEEPKQKETKPVTKVQQKNVPFTISGENISVFLNGKMHNVNKSDASFNTLKELLKEPSHDVEKITKALDKKKYIEENAGGYVTVEKNRVLYKGEPVHSTLTSKLLAMMSDGFDIKPWAKFLENMMENPSYKSRQSLYDFLENFSTPITEDGHFLAFKRVRSDFKDIHSGTFDNSPGKIVEMPRANVDDDSNRTCSAGLHACASNYLGNFYASSPNKKVVVLKINPRDVVSVPVDYSFSKMRVCRYEVLAEAEEATIEVLSSSHFTRYDSDLTADWGE